MSRKIDVKEYIAEVLLGLGHLSLNRREIPAAEKQFREGLDLAQALPSRRWIVLLVEGFARLKLAQGRSEGAACLLGVAQGMREAMGYPLRPVERAAYDHVVTSVRASLGEDAFAAALAQGRANPTGRILAMIDQV